MKPKNYKSFLYTVVCALLINSLNTLSQGVELKWVSYFNAYHQGNDICSGIAADGMGSFYVTASSYDLYYQRSLITTIKYNEYGDQIWTAKYEDTAGLNYRTSAIGIGVDGTGKIYVIGYRKRGILVIKYDSAGRKLWERLYLNQSYVSVSPVSFKIDYQGNVFIAGFGEFVEEIDCGWITLKYNPRGTLEWVKEYDGAHDFLDVPYSIGIDGFNNVYVAGESYNSKTKTQDYTAIKYSASGNEQWIRYYNGTGNSYDVAYSIAVEPGGNSYVAGLSYGAGTREDIVTIKYSPNGIMLWLDRFDTLGLVDVGSIAMLNGLGDIIVSGTILGDINVPCDWCLIKYKPNGLREWKATYSGPSGGEDLIKSMAFDDDYNIYVTGKTFVYGYGDDILTAKYNIYGKQIWTTRFGGNLAEIPAGIVIDRNYNDVYICGSSIREYTNADVFTIQYKQYAGSSNVTVKPPLHLLQNYPNPFNPVTTIKLTIPENDFVTLRVFDVLGKEAAVLINNELTAGTYEVKFDGSNLPSGFYFYRAVYRNYEKTVKMLLLK